MKEFEFTAKAFSFIADGPVMKLLVYCHESDDCKLVIKMGAAQKRIAEDAADVAKLEVIP